MQRWYSLFKIWQIIIHQFYKRNQIIVILLSQDIWSSSKTSSKVVVLESAYATEAIGVNPKEAPIPALLTKVIATPWI